MLAPKPRRAQCARPIPPRRPDSRRLSCGPCFDGIQGRADALCVRYVGMPTGIRGEWPACRLDARSQSTTCSSIARALFLRGEADDRAIILAFVHILQAVNVNAAASASEKCSYETMVVLRVRGNSASPSDRRTSPWLSVAFRGFPWLSVTRSSGASFSLALLALPFPSRISPTSSAIARYV